MKIKFWKRFAPCMSGDSLLGGGAGGSTSTDGSGGGDPAGSAGGSGSQTVVKDPPAGNENGSLGVDTIQLLGLEDYVDGETKLLLGKYKDVKGALDGYKELTSKLRDKNPGAPAEYQFDFSGNEKLKELVQPDGLKDDPLWKAFEPKFKELGITQAQAQSLMESHLLWQLETTPDLEAERTRLGSDSGKILDKLQGMYNSAKTDAEKSALEYIGRNAEALKLVYKLSELSGEQSIPTKVNGQPMQSRNELREAAHKYHVENKDISSNPAKQAIYDKMMREAFGG